MSITLGTGPSVVLTNPGLGHRGRYLHTAPLLIVGGQAVQISSDGVLQSVDEC